jgi:hypothetical protein
MPTAGSDLSGRGSSHRLTPSKTPLSRIDCHRVVLHDELGPNAIGQTKEAHFLSTLITSSSMASLDVAGILLLFAASSLSADAIILSRKRAQTSS